MRAHRFRGTSVRARLVLLCGLLIGFSATGVQSGPDSWTIWFEESSQEVGVFFQTAGEVHDETGVDMAWPAFPEITGAGACWADFTGDGYEDLYIANQRYNEKNPHAKDFNGLFDPTNRFYVNLGDGNFVDRTKEAGLESRTFDYGCSGVDHDASGHVDLLVTGFGHIKLYKNNGDGTFTDVTAQAGLDVSTTCLPYECWTSCSAWVDYNGSGHLDLFVCTFVESDMEDGHRSPGNHVAQYNLLFKNNGDGTFTEVAKQAGVEGIAADAQGSKSWGAVWFDANRNGLPDLYVANDQTPNEFYWNNGDGTFTRDDQAGLYDPRAGMGVTSGDSTGNGHPDLFFTHFAAQHNGYYENNADGTFTDRSGEDGLAADWMLVGWGTHFVDLDRDGHLDLVVANGATEWGSMMYNQQTLLFQQEPQGDGTTMWVDRSGESGPDVLDERVSRGLAVADFDFDGNVDLLVGNNANQSVQLLRGSGVSNHWLYVQPVQGGPNPQAVGARVILESGGVEQYREIQAGSSFLSQNSLLADFGVGGATKVDRLTIEWPDGGTTVVEDLPVDRVVRVDRETGTFGTDTLSPLTKALFQGEQTLERWFTSEIEVVLVAMDRAVGPASGLAKTEYRIDGGQWTLYEGETLQFPEEEANHTLRFRSMDNAGNLEPVRTERFGIDLTPPMTDHRLEGTPGSNGWWVDAQLVIAAEDPLSGVDEILYRIDGGDWWVYTKPVELDEGVHFVEYKATDVAGNEAPVRNVEVRVDATPPEVDFLRPERGVLYFADEPVAALGAGPALVVASDEAAGVGGALFTLRLGSSDAMSGVERLTLWLNGQQVADFMSPDDEQEWVWDTQGYPVGTYLFQAVAQDEAGNVESTSRFVGLVPGTAQSVWASVGQGPSLYPWGPVGWPLG